MVVVFEARRSDHRDGVRRNEHQLGRGWQRSQSDGWATRRRQSAYQVAKQSARIRVVPGNADGISGRVSDGRVRDEAGRAGGDADQVGCPEWGGWSFARLMDL